MSGAATFVNNDKLFLLGKIVQAGFQSFISNITIQIYKLVSFLRHFFPDESS